MKYNIMGLNVTSRCSIKRSGVERISGLRHVICNYKGQFTLVVLEGGDYWGCWRTEISGLACTIFRNGGFEVPSGYA